MADEDDYEDIPEYTDFFSQRAKFVPKLSSEEFEGNLFLIYINLLSEEPGLPR